MDYISNVGATVSIYVVLALSLNIVMGYVGTVTVAQAAFMGLGAYSTAILTTQHAWPFLPTVLVGMGLSVGLGLILLWPAMRITGLLYAVVSFAVMVIVVDIFTNLTTLTGGAAGIPGIPRVRVGLFHLVSNEEFFLAYGIIAVLVFIVTARIGSSVFGLQLRAIREDERAARAAGLSVLTLKVKAFVISAALASLAGSMYAPFIGYVDPSTFSITLSFLLIAIVIVGGSGNVYGVTLGAILLTVIPDIITFFRLPSTLTGALAQVIYAAALLIILRFRPRGILPERRWIAFDRRVRSRLGDLQTEAE